MASGVDMHVHTSFLFCHDYKKPSSLLSAAEVPLPLWPTQPGTGRGVALEDEAARRPITGEEEGIERDGWVGALELPLMCTPPVRLWPQSSWWQENAEGCRCPNAVHKNTGVLPQPGCILSSLTLSLPPSPRLVHSKLCTALLAPHDKR